MDFLICAKVKNEELNFQSAEATKQAIAQE